MLHLLKVKCHLSSVDRDFLLGACMGKDMNVQCKNLNCVFGLLQHHFAKMKERFLGLKRLQ